MLPIPLQTREDAMKEVAKELLRTIVTKLPWGARVAILDELIKDKGGRYVFLSQLASEFHVTEFTVNGRYGAIRGSSQDRELLRQYAENEVWAETSNNLLGSFFAEGGGYYIDIGANIGTTTIPIAQNPLVTCLALEPEPDNYSYLLSNISANCPHGNVQTKRIAAYSSAGTISFILSPDNKGDHRVRVTNNPGQFQEESWKTIEIETDTLDVIAKDILGPLVVKIDTQGAEGHVIQGGRKTLSRANMIIMEYWPYGIARMKSDPNMILDFLRQNFTRASIIRAGNSPESEYMSINDACAYLEQLSPEKKYQHVDLVVRRE